MTKRIALALALVLGFAGTVIAVSHPAAACQDYPPHTT